MGTATQLQYVSNKLHMTHSSAHDSYVINIYFWFVRWYIFIVGVQGLATGHVSNIWPLAPAISQQCKL